jgi:hypothetical protein
MSAEERSAAAHLSSQMTRAEREATASSLGTTERELAGRIEHERTARRLPLFEDGRAAHVAKLESIHAQVARQRRVAEASLLAA